MLSRRRSFVVATTAALLTAGALTVVAAPNHEQATGVVKERMERMERFEELIERVFAMLHGELGYDATAVRKAGQEIADGAGEHLVELFPPASLGPPSEARREIWQEMRRFEVLAARLQDFARLLSDSAEGARESRDFDLPKDWEDVPPMVGMMGGGRGGMMGGGMMGGGPGRGMMGDGPGRGMMGGPGPGMMAGGLSVEGAAWHVAHACNTCHELYRKGEH